MPCPAETLCQRAVQHEWVAQRQKRVDADQVAIPDQLHGFFRRHNLIHNNALLILYQANTKPPKLRSSYNSCKAAADSVQAKSMAFRQRNAMLFLARSAGVEPTTNGVGGRYSIH